MRRAREVRTGGRRRRDGAVAWALVGLVVGGLATGCTDDAPADAPTTGPSDAASASDREPDAGPDTAAERPRGPLERLLETVTQGDVESTEVVVARQERWEELVAACMAEEGFEYLPAAAPGLAEQGEQGSAASALALDPDEAIAAAALYGYGITTASMFDAANEAEDEVVDPNAEQVAAMSDAERRAWELALHGPGQGDEYVEGDEAYDWTKYGCVGRAGHETEVDVREGFDDSAWADLRADISDVESAVPGDPRLAETRAAWAACMTDAGYSGYADPQDPLTEIMERASAIWEQASAGAVLDMSTDDYLTDPAYLQQQAETARLEAELAPVEIALAVADATCRAEVDYDAKYTETWIAMQEEFYAAHRTDLDAWLAAYEEFQAAGA